MRRQGSTHSKHFAIVFCAVGGSRLGSHEAEGCFMAHVAEETSRAGSFLMAVKRAKINGKKENTIVNAALVQSRSCQTVRKGDSPYSKGRVQKQERTRDGHGPPKPVGCEKAPFAAILLSGRRHPSLTRTKNLTTDRRCEAYGRWSPSPVSPTHSRHLRPFPSHHFF
jgi:hypothetical protein